MSIFSLSTDQAKSFHQNGFLVVKSVYDRNSIELIQKGIYEIIGLVMKQNGIVDRRSTFSPAAFDDDFNHMIGKNRALGSVVYDAVKQIPEFIRLLGNPLHEEIMKQLRPGAMPALAGGGYGIRIDNPGEDKFKTFWHQEYPAQLRSINGLVFWSPLVRVTPELGPVQVCAGSHVEGALPVVVDSGGEKNRSGAYSLRLDKEAKYLMKYLAASPLLEPTDLIILDFLVIHSSGYNRADRSRWSMQFRYFDMAEPTGMSHGWRGSYASGVDFTTIHPELFVKKDSGI